MMTNIIRSIRDDVGEMCRPIMMWMMRMGMISDTCADVIKVWADGRKYVGDYKNSNMDGVGT